MAKSKNIARVFVRGTPGNDYIKAFEVIYGAVLSVPLDTKGELTKWYTKEHKTDELTASGYVNTLFNSGLLQEGEKGIECPPYARQRSTFSRKIIETLDRNVVFVVEILEVARDGATQGEIAELGKRTYGVSNREISYRKGWLRAAGMLESSRGVLRTTEKGERLLGGDVPPSLPPLRQTPIREVKRTEFGGKGEGFEHKTLKEYVARNIDQVLEAAGCLSEPTVGHEVECQLPSGDRVDVTGWSEETIWHVEVKSKISGDADLERGLYQCIKYNAVEEASEGVRQSGRSKDVTALLVVEKDLSAGLKKLSTGLEVHTYILGKDMRKELEKMRETRAPWVSRRASRSSSA